MQVTEALHISGKTLQKIRQNLVWAFAYNAVALPLAAGALLPAAGLALTPSIAGACSSVLGCLSLNQLLTASLQCSAAPDSCSKIQLSRLLSQTPVSGPLD